MSFETITWKNGKVVLLDQLRLPSEEFYSKLSEPEEVARAIEKMMVRGAPAIGVTTAFGLALAAQKVKNSKLAEARSAFSKWATRFSKTRPTAVNLFWAIKRMGKIAEAQYETTIEWADRLLEEAHTIKREDIDACKRMGEFGAEFVPKGAKVLTHCNAGALATAGWGTALGVIRSAHDAGKNITVWVDETRPYLQGARLTSWELLQDQIPATLITDNMAGYLMSQKEVDLIVVGADRIAANGDVANKIGTYSLSVLAKENKIPFYVAAPLSTIDMECPSGSEIPIEERNPKEVREVLGKSLAPEGFPARHPAFDVTPARYITAIFTEVGVAKPPDSKSIRALKRGP